MSIFDSITTPEALSLKGNEVILEIGTGSGYQTSILSILSRRVYSIERIRPLLVNAVSCFKKLKLTNIICECGDGFLGWSKLAPFDNLKFVLFLKISSVNLELNKK